MLKSRVSPGFTQFYEEQQSIDIVGFYVVAGLRVEWLKPIAQGLEPEVTTQVTAKAPPIENAVGKVESL